MMSSFLFEIYKYDCFFMVELGGRTLDLHASASDEVHNINSVEFSTPAIHQMRFTATPRGISEEICSMLWVRK